MDKKKIINTLQWLLWYFVIGTNKLMLTEFCKNYRAALFDYMYS